MDPKTATALSIGLTLIGMTLLIWKTRPKSWRLVHDLTIHFEGWDIELWVDEYDIWWWVAYVDGEPAYFEGGFANATQALQDAKAELSNPIKPFATEERY